MSFRKCEVAVGLVRVDVFEEVELGVLLLGGAAKPADPAGHCLGPGVIARAAHDRRDADDHVGPEDQYGEQDQTTPHCSRIACVDCRGKALYGVAKSCSWVLRRNVSVMPAR